MRKLLFLFFTLLCFSLQVVAQSSMTDNQVMQFMMKESERGTPRNEIVTKLIERGVSIEQIRRIRDKYEKQQDGSVVGAKNISGTTGQERLRTNNGDERELQGQYQRSGTKKAVNTSTMSRKQREAYERERKASYLDEMEGILPDSLDNVKVFPEDEWMDREMTGKQVFGRNIFNNRNLTFEPNMNIATPNDYRLGPGDAVFIDVWGASQERFESTVTPDGTVVIDNYGPVSVDGLTVSQANQRLKATLGQRYGGSNVRLTVGQTRTITVDVMGEVVVPGTYTLSAFATVFNALYMAGGTNEIGTPPATSTTTSSTAT